MSIVKKSITEITITGHGDSFQLRLTGDAGWIDGVQYTSDACRVIAAELAAHFGPMVTAKLEPVPEIPTTYGPVAQCMARNVPMARYCTAEKGHNGNHSAGVGTTAAVFWA